MANDLMEPIEVRAFPSKLAPNVKAVASSLVKNQLHIPTAGFVVNVSGDQLEIPHRVYYQAEKIGRFFEGSNAFDDEAIIACCLGTRHHDGFLREKCLDQIVAVDKIWVVPFVVRLVGEYVVEIISRIEEHLPAVRPHIYAEFLCDNPIFLQRTESQVGSYWDVYYKNQFPVLGDYPGYRVIRGLKKMIHDYDNALRLEKSGQS